VTGRADKRASCSAEEKMRKHSLGGISGGKNGQRHGGM